MVTRARSVLIGSLIAVVTLTVAPGLASGQSVADPEVVEIQFVGNAAFSDRDLQNAILTEPTRCRMFLFVFPLPLCPLAQPTACPPGPPRAPVPYHGAPATSDGLHN